MGFSFEELAQRRSQFLETYGNSDHIRDWIDDEDFKPHYEPLSYEAYGDFAGDPKNKARLQQINTERARWNDLSDSERLMSRQDYKDVNLDFERHTKKQQSLQEESKIMDQREARSKAIGGQPSGGGRRVGGGGSDPSIFDLPTGGRGKSILGA